MRPSTRWIERLAVTAAVACGSSVVPVGPDGAGAAGGTGGESADGGGGAGIGGSDGGGAPIDPAWEAYCEAHAQTYCERAFACSPILANYQTSGAGDAVACARYTKRSCLALFSRPDAASIEDRWACLASWPEACHAYVGFTFGAPHHLWPECFLPGARGLGEPCRTPAQCQSLHCEGNTPDQCGSCAERGEEGAPCGPGAAPCANGLACHTGSCMVAHGPGGACFSGGRGTPPEICVESRCENNVCVVPAITGEACGEVGCEPVWHDCVDDICVSDEILPPGAPCAFPDRCDGGWCVEGTCLAYRGEGEACGEPPTCEPGLACVGGSCQLPLPGSCDPP